MIVSRETLLGVKLRKKKIVLPQDLGAAYVRELTGDERAEIELLSVKIKDDKKAYKSIAPLTISYCLVNENGERIFTDEDAANIGKVLPAKMQDFILNALTELNNSEDDIKKSPTG